MGDEEHYIFIATKAAQVEKAAIEADLRNQNAEAIRLYTESCSTFVRAVERCADANPDSTALWTHINSIEGRIAYLEDVDRQPSQNGKKLGPQEHLTRANLKGDLDQYGVPSAKKTLGAAAAVAGGVGLLAVGPLAGVVLAGAAAYATTRGDAVGDVARGAGVATVQATRSLRDANQRYGITDTAKEGGKWVGRGFLAWAFSRSGSKGAENEVRSRSAAG